ncbi:MAG: hypothetical protein CVU69_09865 [Deltaproteobacteria bacterium HGW-Deltaproteobacteria-4]|nr:MAG: hypothetical protein CVU69_09865 [Deltaproteobacteria bacterium HGW-Deltaproteobacteria-4]
MMNYRKGWFVELAATVVFLTACGGGGGGGGSDTDHAASNYSGARTQAYLDANNAEALVLGAYGGMGYRNIIPLTAESLTLSDTSAAVIINPFNLSTLTQKTVEMVKQNFEIKPQSLLDPAEICSNYPSGTTSDTLVESFSATAVSMNGNITFSNCDMEGVIYDGMVTMAMSLDLQTFLVDKLSMTMNSLSINDGVTSYVMYGNISGTESIDNAGFLVSHLTLNVTLEGLSGKTYWLNQYKIDGTEENTGTRSSISGRYYDNDYGYVDFGTLETIFIPYNPFEATYDGLIKFIGSNNSYANLWLGVNQNDYCINVFNASGVVNLGTCAP